MQLASAIVSQALSALLMDLLAFPVAAEVGPNCRPDSSEYAAVPAIERLAEEEVLLLQTKRHEVAAANDAAERLWEPLAEQVVVAFVPYSDYAGSLPRIQVSGRITIHGTGLLKTAAQTLSWELTGVDGRCTSVPNVKSACGIHIHTGTECDAKVGGHYFNTDFFNATTDPWASVSYQAQQGVYWSTARESNRKVTTGLSNFDVLDHVVVLHDADGFKMACGVIIPRLLAVPAFTSYKNYAGSLTVQGTAAVASMPMQKVRQRLSWNLAGTDPKCEKFAGEKHGSCGIHIHEGTTCTSDAGGHFWSRAARLEDPWTRIVYNSGDGDRGASAFLGFDLNDLNGRTMVVHDFEGTRIACGILAPPRVVANALVPYEGYSGDLKVSGWVLAEGGGVVDSAWQSFSWRLEGVDPACIHWPWGEGVSPSACGIHIHEGGSCSADAGGHLYDNVTIAADPWRMVKYTSEIAEGGWVHYASALRVTVFTGMTNQQALGHTVIVHDSKGERVACGILNVAA